MSNADSIFIQNCRDIISGGSWDKQFDVRPRWLDGEPAYTIKKFCVVNRYDLSREFPILTIRKTNLPAAIDEILWIWQKKTNVTAALSSKIWNAWTGEDGTIGKAYGYQMAQQHRYSEGMFDQVDRVLHDLRHNPSSRRMITNMYVHADLHEMNLYPCAYSMTFNVADGRLCAILNQRSQDMLLANNWNVTQYAVLLMMLARASGLEAGELVHVIADAHIYDRHIPIVEEAIAKQPLPAPVLRINPDVTDFYAFKADDFQLEGYEYHKLGKKIEVAV